MATLTEKQSQRGILSLVGEAGQLMADLTALLDRWSEHRAAGVWPEGVAEHNIAQLSERLLASARVVSAWLDNRSPDPRDVCAMLTPCELFPD